MQNFRDYYKILGVAQTATANELKTAYRRAARRYHPDLNPDDETAEEKFKEMGEAYEILSDQGRREEYDQFSQFLNQQKSATGVARFNPLKRGGKDYSQFKDFNTFVDYLLNQPTTPPPPSSPSTSRPTQTPSSSHPSRTNSAWPTDSSEQASTTNSPVRSPSDASDRQVDSHSSSVKETTTASNNRAGTAESSRESFSRAGRSPSPSPSPQTSRNRTDSRQPVTEQVGSERTGFERSTTARPSASRPPASARPAAAASRSPSSSSTSSRPEPSHSESSRFTSARSTTTSRFASARSGPGRPGRQSPNPSASVTEAQLTVPLVKAYKGGRERIRLADGRSLSVTLPPAMLSGQTIRLTAHEPSNDELALLIKVAPHSLFKLRMPDIYCQIPITPSEAVLGGSIDVPTLDGAVKMTLPAGAHSGQKLRLTGKGYPYQGKRGDQIIELQVQIPLEITTRERELYEKLRRIDSFRPRKNLTL